MEYVDGGNLSDLRIKKPSKVFNPSDLVEWLEPLLDVLEYAHIRQQIVHGDLKPRNLMLNSRGDLKVADFGISRSISGSMNMLTGKLASSGSPPYVSPQQWDGKPPTPLDDIYSLGATLYELLTSKPPLLGVIDWQQVHHKIAPPMWQRRLDLGIKGADPIPPEWEETIAACLAKDPRDRPQSVRELKALLTPAKPYLDENVQFTVFRPGSIEPLKWYPMVAFAHLSAKRADAPEGESDPVEEMQRQARAALQGQFEDYQDLTQDSSQGVPREGELTFVPLIAGVTFNPSRRTFIWTESVHREEFRMRTQATPGQTLRGSMSVFLGRIILADIKLTIRVASPGPAPSKRTPEQASATRYRKIFASVLAQGSRCRRGTRPAGAGVWRRILARFHSLASWRSLGRTPAWFDRGSRHFPIALVVELDAFAVRASGMGACAQSAASELHSAYLLGAANARFARGGFAAGGALETAVYSICKRSPHCAGTGNFG